MTDCDEEEAGLLSEVVEDAELALDVELIPEDEDE